MVEEKIPFTATTTIQPTTANTTTSAVTSATTSETNEQFLARRRAEQARRDAALAKKR